MLGPSNSSSGNGTNTIGTDKDVALDDVSIRNSNGCVLRVDFSDV
jgi:hypothetical protein